VRHRYVDRVVLPRHDDGCDWGSVRWVLARRGDRELVWWTPGKSWVGVLGGYRHRGGELFFTRGDRRGYTERVMTVFEDGRVTRERLLAHAVTLNEFFGAKVAHLIDPRRTLVLEK
jgi:hypothetical protein